ncbi:MAG: alpha-L-fucosidase [Terriglobia bacterium]|jgi:alpha-L-fucosidase
MKRRHFLTQSLAASSLAYGFKGPAPAPGGSPAEQNLAAAAEGKARFEELNKALDRGAMQRGWATQVDPSYQHAPQAAIEAFKDRKFGIRIHWGLYCLIGSDASWALAGANKQFWDTYNVFYQFFNPTSFDADAWMDLFEQAGVRYFTFTTKHHDGFSMWPTKTMQESLKLTPQGFGHGGVENVEKVVQSYSIQDGPYKKDIVRSMVEAGRRKGMGVGLYYSHVDWHDPAFAWDPFNQYYDPHFTRESDPARWQTFIAHEREQVRELMSEYGRIDYLDFDIGWPQAAAQDLAKITMEVRKMQPDVIIRGRGIGAYGDYYTPEREIPGGPSQGVWKVIYPCGTAFSYRPNDLYKTAEWIVESLIGITAKGGNFEVGFGPMPNGEWPPETVERLKYAGSWLSVNGVAIYNTRPRKIFHEGKDVWFTSSKDGRYVYAISMGWPGETFTTHSVRAVQGSSIRMLGVDQPLDWRQDGTTLTVTIPSSLADHKPCPQAYAFKILAEPE